MLDQSLATTFKVVKGMLLSVYSYSTITCKYTNCQMRLGRSRCTNMGLGPVMVIHIHSYFLAAYMDLRWGWYKTWTLDSGLDYGLDYGLDFGLDSKLNSHFQAFPLSST